jgi:hypothetical protein
MRIEKKLKEMKIMSNYERELRNLIRRFGLTRREAEGLLSQLNETLASSEKPKILLVFLALLLIAFIGIWLYNELVKRG